MLSSLAILHSVFFVFSTKAFCTAFLLHYFSASEVMRRPRETPVAPVDAALAVGRGHSHAARQRLQPRSLNNRLRPFVPFRNATNETDSDTEERGQLRLGLEGDGGLGGQAAI